MLRPGRARSGRAHPHTAPCRAAAALALGPALLWLPPVTMATRARRRRERAPGARAAREGAASVAWPGGDVAGGAQSWARLGPAWVPALVPPWSLLLGSSARRLLGSAGTKGEKARKRESEGRLQSIPGHRGPSCPLSVPHALSPSPRQLLHQTWATMVTLATAERLPPGHVLQGASLSACSLAQGL